MGDMRHVLCLECRAAGYWTILDVLNRNSDQDDNYVLERELEGCEAHGGHGGTKQP